MTRQLNSYGVFFFWFFLVFFWVFFVCLFFFLCVCSWLESERKKNAVLEHKFELKIEIGDAYE